MLRFRDYRQINREVENEETKRLEDIETERKIWKQKNRDSET